MDETEESVALILASHEDVISHGHVLYGLVRQGQEPNTVESTSRMVNVVPTKRIYCMESVDELVEFRKELLKRPLVLQPIIQAGTGIQSLDCFFCVKKESWVLMVNQFHSKIMEKISAGMDLAARAMFRGEGFVLVFSFGDILKKHYYGNIAKHVSSSFAYTDCEFGDVIIRSSPNKSTSKKVAQLKVSFEDVVASEIKVRTLEEAAQEKRSPVLEFIPISQLAEILPRWVFDEVEVEESIVSTSDYHSDTNIGATGGDVITTQPRHQRSSAHNRPNKHFIAVDLHTPQEPFQSIPEEDPSQDSDCDYEVGRYFHYHQGSGRSDSSVADSGYEDTGYQEKTRMQGRSNRKQLYCPENNRHIQNDRPQVHEKKNRNKQYLHVGNLRKNYDNLAYSSDEDIRGSHYDDIRNSNYYEPEVDVIVTRTGKQTFKSLDKESLTARMMDESVM